MPLVIANMTTINGESFAFQPWTRQTADESNLKDVLARVNLERGHFRSITEASLQEEIAAEGGLDLSESDNDSSDDEDGEDLEGGSKQPTTRAELFKARMDMLANVRAAEQDILMATDFVSLLLTKDGPKSAQQTMSPALRNAVPIGTLGTDIWQRMPRDTAREAQDDLLATNVRLRSLQKSADAVLSAANNLNDNVRKQTEYWDQILAISERGWNVCRIPRSQGKLGVSFGFSESSPEFSRRGIAALNANSDGTVVLDRGGASSNKALRAVLRKDGEIIGVSKVPTIPKDEETTLEARIRYARDSLFDEELYHEIIRESRTLASLGVGMRGSAISFILKTGEGNSIDMSLDLVSLDEEGVHITESTHAENDLAQAIVLGARLLLGQSHRDRLKKRSEIPPPMSDDKKDDRPLLPILRPVMAFVMHRAVLAQLNAYIDKVYKMLHTAKIEASHQLAQFKLQLQKDELNAEDLISLLMQPWISNGSLSISPPDSKKLTLDIRVETTLANKTGSVFFLSTSGDSTQHRFDSLDELEAATDANMASSLAMGLQAMLGQGWKCNEHEASLFRSGRVDEEDQQLWIRFDSGQDVLTVSSPSSESTCHLTGNDYENSFWDAARELAWSG